MNLDFVILKLDLINAPAYKPRQETNGPTPVTQGLQQQVHNNPSNLRLPAKVEESNMIKKNKEIFSSLQRIRDLCWSGGVGAKKLCFCSKWKYTTFKNTYLDRCFVLFCLSFNLSMVKIDVVLAKIKLIRKTVFQNQL